MKGDLPDGQVIWRKGSIADLKGIEVRLRFALRNAMFYSYWLQSDSETPNTTAADTVTAEQSRSVTPESVSPDAGKADAVNVKLQLVGKVTAGKIRAADPAGRPRGPFVADEEGFIKDWLVIGPFADLGGRPSSAGFKHDFLKPIGGEARVRLRPGMSVIHDYPPNRSEWLLKSRRQELVARAYRSPDPLIDWLKCMPLKNDVLAYAYCHVVVPEAMAHGLAVGNRRVGVIARCQWGGPQTAILGEDLAELGVRFVLGVGAAGSLRADLPKGTQVVATAALCGDGTSRAYCNENIIEARQNPLEAAQEAAHQSGTPLRRTVLATTDAIFRESEEQAAQWRAAGAEAVCMEAAPLMACARTCGIPCLWLGHISDCLVAHEWEPWQDLEQMARTTARLARAILEILGARGF